METSSISPRLTLSVCCIILTTLSGSCAFRSNAHGWGAGGGLEPTSGSQLSLSAQLCPVKPPSHSREKSVWQSLPSSEPWQTQLSRRKPTTPGKWLFVPSPQGKGVGWQALGGGLADTATRAISWGVGDICDPPPQPRSGSVLQRPGRYWGVAVPAMSGSLHAPPNAPWVCNLLASCVPHSSAPGSQSPLWSRGSSHRPVEGSRF